MRVVIDGIGVWPHARQIALDVAGLLIAMVFLTLDAPGLRSQSRCRLVAVIFGALFISLVASHRLAH
jgi:hypothetical protein